MRRLVLLLALANLAASDPRLAIGVDEHVGQLVPRALVFTDSTGHTAPLSRLLDGTRPSVLVLAYTRCTMLCSVVLRGMADAVRATPGDYLPIVVSIDPRETPDEAARVQNHLLERSGRLASRDSLPASSAAEGRRGSSRRRDAWPFLVGDAANIAALADALGFRYAWDARTEQYAHPAVAIVLTPDGRIAEYLHGARFDELGAAVARAHNGQLTTATTRDLLRCFHFDPALRRYASRIATLYRAAAALVVLSLLAVIAVLVRLERRRQR